jgi:hypothetical protein
MSASADLPETVDHFIGTLELLAECPICRDTYKPDHVAAKIPICGHVVGQPCLLKWVKTRNENADKCPVCRTQLFKPPAGGEPYVPFLQRVWTSLGKFAVDHDLLIPCEFPSLHSEFTRHWQDGHA